MHRCMASKILHWHGRTEKSRCQCKWIPYFKKLLHYQHILTKQYVHELCQETWIQHRKAQEIGEHDLSGFTAWISKNTCLIMSLVILEPLAQEHGIKKRTRSIRKHCLTEPWCMGWYGGRQSSHVPSAPQSADITYQIYN